jgi:hypothetical protein
MAVAGILTCEMLALEMTCLLKADSQIERVTVLEDTRSAAMIEALESSGYQKLARIPHIRSFYREPSRELEVAVRVMEMGLHRNRNMLIRALVKASHELQPHVDVLFLGYGDCGGALHHPKEVLDLNIPVFISMDGLHPSDDCIGIMLGSRERYHTEQLREPGTFFMTPEWTCGWKKTAGPEYALKRIFRNYKRVLLIKTDAMSEDEMRRNAGEFTRSLDLKVDRCCGTLDRLSEAWALTKASILTGEGRSRQQ